MTAAAIIQARMGSTRLPGKTLEPLGHAVVLAWVVERTKRASALDEVVVATSTAAEDDRIEDCARDLDVRCVRGSREDVLGRYAAALEETSADTIVRITADCPFVDPDIVDRTIHTLDSPDAAFPADYASTGLDGRYPRGLDVEAVRRDVLEIAASEATTADEREHVTLFIYRRPERFTCAAVPAPEWAQRPDLRVTLDEAADLEVIRAVVAGLGASAASLTIEDVISFLDDHPEVAAINRSVRQRTV